MGDYGKHGYSHGNVKHGEHEEAHKEHINKYKMAHMIGVAEHMRERAEDYGVDPDVAYMVGLMHDIGYLEGRAQHEQKGAEMLKKIGVSEEVAQAISLHGTSPYTLESEQVDSPLLVLLYEADMSVDARGYRVGFDKRLKDIECRLRDTEYYDVAVRTSTETVEYVKQWQKEHGVEKPPRDFFYHKHREEKGRD